MLTIGHSKPHNVSIKSATQRKKNTHTLFHAHTIVFIADSKRWKRKTKNRITILTLILSYFLLFFSFRALCFLFPSFFQCTAKCTSKCANENDLTPDRPYIHLRIFCFAWMEPKFWIAVNKFYLGWLEYTWLFFLYIQFKYVFAELISLPLFVGKKSVCCFLLFMQDF